MAQDGQRLKTPDAAAYVGLAAGTLETDRNRGTLGIPFHKLGRAVVYDTRALDAWLATRKRLSTSDPGEDPRDAKKTKQEIRAST